MEYNRIQIVSIDARRLAIVLVPVEFILGISIAVTLHRSDVIIHDIAGLIGGLVILPGIAFALFWLAALFANAWMWLIRRGPILRVAERNDDQTKRYTMR